MITLKSTDTHAHFFISFKKVASKGHKIKIKNFAFIRYQDKTFLHENIFKANFKSFRTRTLLNLPYFPFFLFYIFFYKIILNKNSLFQIFQKKISNGHRVYNVFYAYIYIRRESPKVRISDVFCVVWVFHQ